MLTIISRIYGEYVMSRIYEYISDEYMGRLMWSISFEMMWSFRDRVGTFWVIRVFFRDGFLVYYWGMGLGCVNF